MAGFTKNREKTEILAGLVTMGVAVLLLIFAVIFMTRCSAEKPEEADRATDPTTTASTQAPLPTLADNPYGPGDFAYRDGYLTCIAGGSILGIDVSSHQGYIDWEAVANANIGFAIVRVGYRGYEAGNICEDTMWRENIQQAKAQGLKVGVYFFSQAINTEEALEEAQFVLGLLEGMKLDLPVVFDWEPISDSARTANMDAETLNACAKTYCNAVSKAGYQPMVYFNIDLSSRLLDLQQMQDAGYQFWLALYSNQMTFPHKIQMWQYSDGGSVPGIQGDVDLNLYFTYE